MSEAREEELEALLGRLLPGVRWDVKNQAGVHLWFHKVFGVFAAENGSTEQVNLLTLHWSGVPQWLPPVVAGGGVAVLLTLYMLYAGGRHGVRQRGLKGRIGKHESRISELQTENERLRQEVAELRTRGPIAPGDRTV